MRRDQHYHPFKLAIRQSLEQTYFHTQKSFAETILDKIDNNGFNVKNLMLNDKVYFHLTGVVNKQDYLYWAHQVIIHSLFMENHCMICAWLLSCLAPLLPWSNNIWLLLWAYLRKSPNLEELKDQNWAKMLSTNPKLMS